MNKITNRIGEGDPGVMFVVSAADLKSAITDLCRRYDADKQKAIEEQRERPTLTREQAAKALNVTLTTLWRWAKDGYLTPVKIGAKTLYRASDIDRLLTPNPCKL